MALVLIQTLVQLHTQKHANAHTIHTDAYNVVPPGSPSANRCFLPRSPIHSASHVRTHTHSASLAPLQVDPGAGWSGGSTLWFSCGVFVNVGPCFTMLARSTQRNPNRVNCNFGTTARQERKLTFLTNHELQRLSDVLIFWPTTTVSQHSYRSR